MIPEISRGSWAFDCRGKKTLSQRSFEERLTEQYKRATLLHLKFLKIFCIFRVDSGASPQYLTYSEQPNVLAQIPVQTLATRLMNLIRELRSDSSGDMLTTIPLPDGTTITGVPIMALASELARRIHTCTQDFPDELLVQLSQTRDTTKQVAELIAIKVCAAAMYELGRRTGRQEAGAEDVIGGVHTNLEGVFRNDGGEAGTTPSPLGGSEG